jgi:hypothetical protein
MTEARGSFSKAWQRCWPSCSSGAWEPGIAGEDQQGLALPKPCLPPPPGGCFSQRLVGTHVTTIFLSENKGTLKLGAYLL